MMGPKPPPRVSGDIWELGRDGWIVTPVNIGWKANEENVMGRGVARQAAIRHPDAAAWYGRWCKQHGHYTPVVAQEFSNARNHSRLIFFPTKRLDENAPHLSWKNSSDPILVERGCDQLLLWALWEMNAGLPVYVPWVGCGNGGLRREVVEPILDSILSYHPCFHIVEFEGGE